MTDANCPHGEPTVLRIDGELTIFRAAEIKQALLAEPAPREIDLSGVTEIDTAGLQLLMLAKRTAQAQQRGWRLSATSAVVSGLFELLKLGAYFTAPPGPSSTGSAAAAPQGARPSREVTP